MRTRYVLLICATAITVVEVLSVLALRGGWVGAEALHSTVHTLYLVAGVGAGRLEASGKVWRAVRAGCLAGVVTGLVGGSVMQASRWAMGLEGDAALGVLVLRLVFLAGVGALTGGALGCLGGIAGWGVRRAVEPVVGMPPEGE